jgi:hypothetical protein
MIKKFKQFNEELSPELLKRAAKSAYDREQRVRGDRFYQAANKAEMEEINSKKKSNYEDFMSLTGGILLGHECKADELRTNPGGDTWIEIAGDFKTKKGNVNKIFIIDDLIKKDKLLIVGDDGDEQTIEIKDLLLDRKAARGYANFLNWWNGEQKPFSVDDYCIIGIHRY